MHPRLILSYRTANGLYQSVSCEFSDPGIVFPGDFAQAWALQNLPSGAAFVSVRTEWTSPIHDTFSGSIVAAEDRPAVYSPSM